MGTRPSVPIPVGSAPTEAPRAGCPSQPEHRRQGATMILTKQRNIRIAVESAVRGCEAAGITVNVGDDWLSLASPFANGCIHGLALPRCARELLLRNADLPETCKLVICTPNRVVTLV